MMCDFIIALSSTTEIGQLYELEKPDNSDGLLAYYPFNGNANDESGNGHHGVVNGATLTNDRGGIASKAYSFDGSNDYMNMGQVLFPNNAFTVGLWVNATSSSQWKHVIENGTVANGFKGAFRFELGNPGESFVAVADGTTIIEPPNGFSDSWTLNQWNYFTITYDGSRYWLIQEWPTG